MDEHPKQKFQVERIAFFSDAIFAIAITLMIIEVKPPHFHKGMSSAEIRSEFLHLMPMFGGVILSFLFIGVYWLRHHQLFKYIKNYDNKLVILNMALLCSVVFLPFSTAFYSVNGLSITGLPMIFYNANYLVTTVLTYFLFRHALNSPKGLAHEIQENKAALLREILFPAFVFVIVILIAMVNPLLSPLGYAAFSFQHAFSVAKKRKTKASAVSEDKEEAREDTMIAAEEKQPA